MKWDRFRNPFKVVASRSEAVPHVIVDAVDFGAVKSGALKLDLVLKIPQTISFNRDPGEVGARHRKRHPVIANCFKEASGWNARPKKLLGNQTLPSTKIGIRSKIQFQKKVGNLGL